MAWSYGHRCVGEGTTMHTNARRRLLLIAICQVFLLLFLSVGVSAQNKVSAIPDSVVDSAKPVPVKLHVTGANDQVDPTIVPKVTSVKVGTVKLSQFTPDGPNGDITITPPPALSGSQPVQILGQSDNVLGETTLKYPAANNASSTPSPTPCPPACDPKEVRKETLINSGWYYPIVGLLFLGLLIPFVTTLTRAIRFSKSTFRNPFGFPIGSFRAILAYTLVAYLGFYVLTSVLSISEFGPPDSLLGIVATVIGFYFGSRTGEAAPPDPQTGIVRGIVRKGPGPAQGASVKFKREDATEPYSRITGIEGRFEVLGVKAGKYKITATL